MNKNYESDLLYYIFKVSKERDRHLDGQREI